MDRADCVNPLPADRADFEEVCKTEVVEVCSEPVIDFYIFIPAKCEKIEKPKCERVRETIIL